VAIVDIHGCELRVAVGLRSSEKRMKEKIRKK